MPELINTFKAMRKTEDEKRKFLASLQGVNLDEEEQQIEGKSFEDVRRKALGINASSEDVLSLQGPMAQEAGFGIGMGLGYSEEK